MDTLVRSSSTKAKSIEVDSVASFVDHVNNTVGKHFRCCICFSILEDPVMLPCNHSLCRGCAMQTMRQHRRCPLCLTNIPNLRTLQGRNKWITSMVDSLRNCLNEVGVNLTQHAPVPAKYLNNAHPPPPRERSRARGRGHAFADRRTRSPSPPVSCGGGVDGATRENGGNANLGRRSRGRTGAKRKRSTPVCPSGAGEETARAPPSSRPRETVGERPVCNEPNTRRSQPRAANNDHVGEAVAQQAEGNLALAPSLSSNAPCPSSSSPPPPFAVGDLVSVDPRSWPGMNKQGGVGFINAVLDPPGSLYDIKYILTRKIERGIDARFVHPHAFLDGTLESRSRRGTGNRETRRGRNRVGSALEKAGGPDLTRERSAAQKAVKSNVAGNAVLRADPSQKPSPFCIAEEHGDASAAGEHTEGKRNATNEMEAREEQVDGETRERSAEVQGNESDTALAVTNGVGKSDSDDARLGRGSGQTKPTENESEKRNGDDEGENSKSAFVAAGGGGRCDLSKAKLRQGCHTVPEKEKRPREDGPIEGGRADDDSDSDMTLIIAGGEDDRDSSDDADIGENGVGADDFLDGEMVIEQGNQKVIEGRHLPVGIGRQSRGDRDKEGNPGIDRVAVVDKKSERPRHREAMVDRPQQAGENSPRPLLTSDVQYDRRGRWTGAPLSKRGPSATEIFAGNAGIEKYIGPAQEVADRLGPAMDSSASSSTRKFEGSPCHEQKAQNTSEDAFQLGLTSEPEKKRQESSSTPSFVSSAHSMPDEPSELSSAACERPPQKVMSPPAAFKSPSQSLKTPLYKVGDLVEVMSRSSPGVNKEGGVARVTRLNTDGTYDVKYCVRHGAEKAVKASIMSLYVMDEEGNRVEEGQLPVPSPSTAGVSVRRTNRRGSCPPDAAVGQANAACLNLILGDTQHPELALDPDLLENLSPIEGGALADPVQQKQNEAVPESGDSRCVTDSSGVVLGGEKVPGKRGRPPRGVKKRKDDGSRHKMRKKKPKVGDRTRESSRALHLASRENGSVSASDSGVEGRPSKSRLGQATVVLTLSSLTPEMIAVAESLSCGHGWKIAPKYTADVTHVVCGTAPRTNKANIRSAKYLRAVASGKWVVNESWLQECRLRGEHVKEEGYEISGDRKSTVPSAPRRSRLAHAEADRPGLFHGTKFHLRGHFGKDSPPKNELEAMLLANGGTVVDSISDLLVRGGGSSIENRCGRRDGRSNSSSGTWRPTRVVIFQPSVDSQEGDMEALARDLAVHSMVPSSSGSVKGGRGGGAKRHGGEVEVVKALWLVDSIGSYRVLQPTIVHRVQLPNCSKA